MKLFNNRKKNVKTCILCKFDANSNNKINLNGWINLKIIKIKNEKAFATRTRLSFEIKL